MAHTELFSHQKNDGRGSVMTVGNTIAVYALTLEGLLDKGFCNILVDIAAAGTYTSAGSLSDAEPAKLIMLPAGAKCTAQLSGATPLTDISVKIAS